MIWVGNDRNCDWWTDKEGISQNGKSMKLTKAEKQSILVTANLNWS